VSPCDEDPSIPDVGISDYSSTPKNEGDVTVSPCKVRCVRYTTAYLYHGPGARDKALQKARDLGRMIEDPIGDDGLKIDDARKIVELSGQVSVGDGINTLVIGPLDRARQAATDALLKTIEEFDSAVFRPVLWAVDAGDVSPTIRSRCRQVWCPGEEPYEDHVLDEARDLIDASLAGDRAKVISVWKDLDHGQVLTAVAKVLESRLPLDKETSKLWERVREGLTHSNPTKYEMLVMFL